MNCRNPLSQHECHPIYAKKYSGYCLECANAGVPELVAWADKYESLSAAQDKVIEAMTAERDRLRAKLKLAGETIEDILVPGACPLFIAEEFEDVNGTVWETCQHEWTDARNQVVLSGEVCLKCGAIRASSHDGGER